ncbi:MAG: hypothetical protein K2K63_12215 [Acetatifactor sp.]|nr:hypothetical protein [Acetatifactor sp.]
MNVGEKRLKTVLLHLVRCKSFICTVAVTLVLSLFCVIRILLPNHTYTFEETASNSSGTESGGNISVCENISLSPGLYRIQLSYAIDADAQGLCFVEDGHVYPGGLLANYDVLYTNLSSTDYTIWLFEATDTLTVAVSLGEGCNLVTGPLTIVETNGLWTMLLTVILFCGACVTGGIAFSVYQRQYGASVRAKNVFFCMTVVVLLSSIPLLLDGVNTGADLGYHFHRIEAVSAGLTSGQFPTRIAPRWPFGQGYADPVFYCNLLLIFPAIFRLLGFPLTVSYQIFAVGVNALTAGIAYYSFSRIFKDYKIGICCSSLYTLSIFRIYRFIVVGALGEGLAQIFLPLILLGLYEVFAESAKEVPAPNAWLHIALGYAGVFQTHVLTSEITILITLVFCLAYIRKIRNKAVFFTLLKGSMVAVLLSLWYLVPFVDYYLTEDVRIRHSSARMIQERGLYLGQLFGLFNKMPMNSVFSGIGMANSDPYGCSVILVAGLVFFLILWYSGKLRDKSLLTRFAKVSAVLAAVLLLFSLQIFPWDRLQALGSVPASLISSLQVPYRFIGWGVCLLVAVMGYCFAGRTVYLGKMGNYFVLGIMFLAVVSACFFMDDVNKNKLRAKVYNEEAIGFGYVSGGEYLIWGTDEILLTFDKPHPSDAVTVSSYVKNNLHITAHCTNRGEEQGYVDMPLLLYKGYQAYDRESGEPLDITYNSNNQLRLLLPAFFSGDIEIKFVSPVYWRAAEAISLIMLIYLLLYAVKRRGRFLRKNPAYERRQHEGED